MPKILTCLWFDDQAEQAAAFYTGVFPNSEIATVTRYGPDMPGPDGGVATVSFSLDGTEFLGLNGGPLFHFDEAISFPVICADQAEVDHYWTRLSADGGEEGPCGWLKDKFGLSWQIIPTALGEALNNSDPVKSKKAMEAMMQMTKIDIAALERAQA
jgi:predicted 3-demethylubiquinone-9 3-methyltransferase (glyoxalase superfamily)